MIVIKTLLWILSLMLFFSCAPDLCPNCFPYQCEITYPEPGRAVGRCVGAPKTCDPTCKQGYVCKDGTCISSSSCKDECSYLGEVQCYPSEHKNDIQLCKKNSKGCLQWDYPIPCEDTMASCSPTHRQCVRECPLYIGGGRDMCFHRCVDLQTDSKNCGKCGYVCNIGFRCKEGKCQ